MERRWWNRTVGSALKSASDARARAQEITGAQFIDTQCTGQCRQEAAVKSIEGAHAQTHLEHITPHWLSSREQHSSETGGNGKLNIELELLPEGPYHVLFVAAI